MKKWYSARKNKQISDNSPAKHDTHQKFSEDLANA